jgi:hypothetical protein
MAASQILLETGTPVAVTMTSLNTLVGLTTSTTTGAQSAKTDLTASRAETMLLRAQLAFTTAPTTGGYVSFYVGFSSISTAASGNPANLSGADATYTGYATDAAVAVSQLQFVGIMSVSVTTSTTVPQVADIGVFTPLDQYVMVVALNNTSQPLTTLTTDKSIKIIPLFDEAQ